MAGKQLAVGEDGAEPMSRPKHDTPGVPMEDLFKILREDWARARLYSDEVRLLLSDDPATS